MIGNHVYRQRYRGFESRPLRKVNGGRSKPPHGLANADPSIPPGPEGSNGRGDQRVAGPSYVRRAARMSAKKPLRSAEHSAPSTPGTSSKRWFKRASVPMVSSVFTMPAFGSSHP